MPRCLSTYEAKAHFSAVLQDVARGETVIITRHGRPIARIVPEPAPVDPDELLAPLRQATRDAGISYDWGAINRPLEDEAWGDSDCWSPPPPEPR